MEETTTEIVEAAETSAPEIIDKGQAVVEAVAERNITKDVLADFGQAVLDFIPTIIMAVIICLIGRIIVHITVKLIDKAVGRSKIDKAAQTFLSSLLNIVLSAIVIVIALSVLGIPMTSIITVIGAAGVAIGLALQNSLSNVAGGFIILFTKPFVKGHYVSVCGVEGTVDAISVMATRITTVDNKVIYIPNGQVSSSTIINYSAEQKRIVERKFSVAYSADLKLAAQVIRDVVAANPKIMHDEPVLVRVSELGESAVTILLRVWVKNSDYWSVLFDLNEDVKAAFDENGIEIPFPQVVVHDADRGERL